MFIPDSNPYLEFIKKHFPGLYIVNWHHNVISYYLHKWVHGEIKDLIIEVPPQYGKTEAAAVMMLPYIFSEYPTAKTGYVTYGDNLATEMSERSKKLMRSEGYKLENNELTVPLSQRSNYKWHNSLNGRHLAAGRGGSIDGFDLDFLICDDLYKNYEEGVSQTVRESVWDFFTQVALARLSPEGRTLLFFKRWHDDDVIGRARRLMELHPDVARHYEVLSFPSLMTEKLFEKKHPADPREPGEALWPHKQTVRQLLARRLEIGDAQFNAVYQQIPVNAEGTKIKPTWFNQINSSDLPSDLKSMQFFYLGELAKNTIDPHNGFCSIAKDKNGRIFILDLDYFESDWPSCLSKIRQVGKTSSVLKTGVQKIGGSKKKALFDQVMACRTSKNKLNKYPFEDPMSWTVDAAKGQFFLVKNEQTVPFLEACRNYTGTGRDKREADIQALAGAWAMTRSRRSIAHFMAAKHNKF